MNAVSQGKRLPDELVGELRESSPRRDAGGLLRSRLAEDGYVLLRGAIDPVDVLAARREVFERLHEVGEVESPPEDGVFTNDSRRRGVGDLGAFWRSVNQGAALRRVSHGRAIFGLMETIFGERPAAHDYMFLRPGVVGRSTHLHYDLPFFARGSQRILTVWTALGAIPVEEGPLMVVENSHRFADLIEPIRAIDYDSNDTPQVQMTDDVAGFARQREARLLTTDFAAGDVAVFTMTTMHGTLDNRSDRNRIRLSCDVRWQPAADPIDQRYAGEDPPGTTGAGYGELNGAKPLTEPWHIR